MNSDVTRFIVPIFALLLVLTGCSKDAAWWDEQERNQPLVHRAADRADQGDIESAVRLYQQAIDNNPGTARAHLDLALLYHDQVKDYVRAVYHYERYLELRPDTDKRELIANRVRLAKQSFAGSLLEGEGASAVQVAKLERENEELRQQAEDLQKEVRRLRARPARPARQAPEMSEAAQPPVQEITEEAPRPQVQDERRNAPGTVRTYKVSSGDTLSSIAQKVYGDRNRWREIQKANAEILGQSSRLQVGQVLVIP